MIWNIWLYCRQEGGRLRTLGSCIATLAAFHGLPLPLFYLFWSLCHPPAASRLPARFAYSWWVKRAAQCLLASLAPYPFRCALPACIPVQCLAPFF